MIIQWKADVEAIEKLPFQLVFFHLVLKRRKKIHQRKSNSKYVIIRMCILNKDVRRASNTRGY